MVPAWIYSFCFYWTEIVQMIVSEVRVKKKEEGTFVTGQELFKLKEFAMGFLRTGIIPAVLRCRLEKTI